MSAWNEWDNRFSSEGYLFGEAPADFVVAHQGLLKGASRLLCVSDGEGRNSVHLAAQGHDVTAFDYSQVALEKARLLANRAGVPVDFHLASVEDWDWTIDFDAVFAIFVQFAAPDLRAEMFHWMKQAVRPGGLLFLHGYAPRQVDYGTGGPPFRSHMYTLTMLETAFDGWTVLHAADEDRTIDEGPGHSGKSALIDFVVQKPD